MPITSAELKRTGESLLHKFIKLTAALMELNDLHYIVLTKDA